MSKFFNPANVIRAAILLPCAAYLAFQTCGTSAATTHAILVGLAVAVVMSAVYMSFMRMITPWAAKFVLQFKDPQTRALAVYVPALGIWVPSLLLPMIVLVLAKPFVAPGTSLAAAWLLGLALTYVFARIVSGKRHPQATD